MGWLVLIIVAFLIFGEVVGTILEVGLFLLAVGSAIYTIALWMDREWFDAIWWTLVTFALFWWVF